jgi:chromosome segregation ATPase
MTYVGKILVIVIMVFALIFLTLSTVVFMTERDWKKEVDRLKEQLGKTTSELNKVKDEKAGLDESLKAAEKDRTDAVAALNTTIEQLKADVGRRQEEITKQRTAVETSQQNMLSAQQEAEAKNRETEKARDTLRLVQQEASNYKIQQKDLNDLIFNLKRDLEVAKSNCANRWSFSRT